MENIEILNQIVPVSLPENLLQRIQNEIEYRKQQNFSSLKVYAIAASIAVVMALNTLAIYKNRTPKTSQKDLFGVNAEAQNSFYYE